MVEFYEALRSLWVVWLLGFFLAIAVWAYWPSNRGRLQSHAQIPFKDDAQPAPAEPKAKG